MRCFVGSRDVPQDVQKATGLFEFAGENAKSQDENYQTVYYKTMIGKFMLDKQILDGTIKMTNEMRIEIEQKRMKTTHNLVALASENHGLANFSYAKELYINLKNGAFNYLPQDQQTQTFERCLKAFEIAASKGVHSANLYLGMIYLEGVYVEKDVERGIDFYVRGAAKNNAFCFFELSRIYSGQDG